MKSAVLNFIMLCAIVAVNVALPAVSPAAIQHNYESDDGITHEARQRRSPQGSAGVDVDRVKGVGTVVSADINRNVWKNDQGSRLDAQGRWTKVVDGPQKSGSNYGGTLTYSDNRGSAFGSIDRQRNFGTSVGVGADRNLWTSRNGMSRLDAQGSWSKVINGPARGKPNYGGFINFSHRF